MPVTGVAGVYGGGNGGGFGRAGRAGSGTDAAVAPVDELRSRSPTTPADGGDCCSAAMSVSTNSEASFCIELGRGACAIVVVARGGTGSGRGWVSGGMETGSSSLRIVVTVGGTSSNLTRRLRLTKKKMSRRRSGTKTETVTDAMRVDLGISDELRREE